MKRTFAVSLGATLATLFFSTAAMAAESTTPPAAAKGALQGASGMRVERDPQSGQLRAATTPPNAAEQALFSADASKVTREDLANGARLYRLNGQGMQGLVAHRHADGALDVQCSDDVDALLHQQGGRDER